MKKKVTRSKNDAIVTVAIIGLISTVITAIFTSPVIIAWLRKEPTPAVLPTVTNDLSATPTQSISKNTPSPEYAFTWLSEPMKVTDFYSTGDVKYSFSPDTGLDVTGKSNAGDNRVWINKILPENFSVVISFTLFEDECLMYTGFGDGQHVKNSYAWHFRNGTANFEKSIESGDLWFVAKPINYISANQISTFVLERLHSNIILKDVDDNVVFRIKPVEEPEWSDINELDTYWVYAGTLGQACTIRYASLKVSEIKE